MPWPILAVVGCVFLIGLLFLAWSLSNQHDFSGGSPIGIILNWFRASVKWVIYLLERGSGQIQNVFSKMNPLMQFLFVVGYGIAQPVLPPAFFAPTTLTWHIIGVFRAAGVVSNPAAAALCPVCRVANPARPRAQAVDMAFVFFLAVDPGLCDPRGRRPVG